MSSDISDVLSEAILLFEIFNDSKTVVIYLNYFATYSKWPQRRLSALLSLKRIVSTDAILANGVSGESRCSYRLSHLDDAASCRLAFMFAHCKHRVKFGIGFCTAVTNRTARRKGILQYVTYARLLLYPGFCWPSFRRFILRSKLTGYLNGCLVKDTIEIKKKFQWYNYLRHKRLYKHDSGTHAGMSQCKIPCRCA